MAGRIGFFARQTLTGFVLIVEFSPAMTSTLILPYRSGVMNPRELTLDETLEETFIEPMPYECQEPSEGPSFWPSLADEETEVILGSDEDEDEDLEDDFEDEDEEEGWEDEDDDFLADPDENEDAWVDDDEEDDFSDDEDEFEDEDDEDDEDFDASLN
jgi:hypothetical protein